MGPFSRTHALACVTLHSAQHHDAKSLTMVTKLSDHAQPWTVDTSVFLFKLFTTSEKKVGKNLYVEQKKKHLNVTIYVPI